MRFFTAILVAIGLLVLVFVLIFKSLTGGPKQPTIDLNSYANTSAVAQLTIDGPINADQTHSQVQISVSNSNNELQILRGYQGQVQTSKTYENNTTSYGEFLHALDLLGFTKGNPDPKLSDPSGYCPQGERYTFELMQGANVIERYWATSCGGQGTYGGDVEKTLDLFQKQAPDYDSLTGNIFF